MGMYQGTQPKQGATMTFETLEMDRRTVLKTLGSVAAGAAFSRFSFAAGFAGKSAKPLRGLFPIASSPFTQDNKLDLDCLNGEVAFCNHRLGPGKALLRRQCRPPARGLRPDDRSG